MSSAQPLSIHTKKATVPDSVLYCHCLLVWVLPLKEADACFSVCSLGSSLSLHLDLCPWPLVPAPAPTQGFHHRTWCSSYQYFLHCGFLMWWPDTPLGFIMGTPRTHCLSSAVDMALCPHSSVGPSLRWSVWPMSGQISPSPSAPPGLLCLTAGPTQVLTGDDSLHCREPASFVRGLIPGQRAHLLACK